MLVPLPVNLLHLEKQVILVIPAWSLNSKEHVVTLLPGLKDTCFRQVNNDRIEVVTVSIACWTEYSRIKAFTCRMILLANVLSGKHMRTIDYSYPSLISIRGRA
jgi:hypothetical protein